MEKTIFPLHPFFNLARKRLLDKSHDPSVMHLGFDFHGENLQVWIPLEIRAKVDELLIRGREKLMRYLEKKIRERRMDRLGKKNCRMIKWKELRQKCVMHFWSGSWSRF